MDDHPNIPVSQKESYIELPAQSYIDLAGQNAGQCYIEPPFPELLKSFRSDPLALLNRRPGIFLLDKPQGLTSHDVVARMRRQLKMKRVGHGGTLDPLATGLLIIFAGNATRLFDALQDYDKEYVARFRLGEATDTQDITGTVLSRCAPDLLPVSRERLEEALDKFRGEIMQMPPMYSALKVGGKKLCDVARAGGEIEREARPVELKEAELLSFDGGEGEIRMAVSKGFYVRTLLHDLGAALGTGAVMTALRRTRIGPFTLARVNPSFVLEGRRQKDEG